MNNKLNIISYALACMSGLFFAWGLCVLSQGKDIAYAFAVMSGLCFGGGICVLSHERDRD